MTKLTCEECNHIVSANAAACPSCGAAFRQPTGSCAAICAFLAIIFLGLPILGLFVNAIRPIKRIQSQPTITTSNPGIFVTSDGMKMVAGNYRYFFVVHNASARVFRGGVEITLTHDSNERDGKTAIFDGEIQPGVGKSVFIDSNEPTETFAFQATDR